MPFILDASGSTPLNAAGAATFLDLVRDLRQECGIAGSGPTSVVGQMGELRHLVHWIAQAYVEIQTRHGAKWRWLKREFTLPIEEGTSVYRYYDADDSLLTTPIDRFASWHLTDLDDPPMIAPTDSIPSGERWMSYVDWSSFRTIYRIGSQTPSAPHHISINDQDSLVFGPAPNGDYTVTGHYWRAPQVLVEDEDEPEMPWQFHKLIVYKAMEKYAGFNSAPEVMIRAKNEGGPLMRQLENNQLLRGFRLARPLA